MRAICVDDPKRPRREHAQAKALATALVMCAAVASMSAAGEGGAPVLMPKTAEAFEQYVRLTEARIEHELSGDAPFLWADRLPDPRRAEVFARLRTGEVVITRLETRDAGTEIATPGGLIHHWIGTVWIPGVTVQQTIAMVQNYDRYHEIYGPVVRRSRRLSQDGDHFTAFTQLLMKKVVTVVLNTEYDIRYRWLDQRHVHVRSYASRIAEVEEPDSPEEREKPAGQDRGFLWRFNNYCSFEEKADGAYMQCESISLTRGIPAGLGWIIRPFVSGIPKEQLTFTLEAARRYLTRR